MKHTKREGITRRRGSGILLPEQEEREGFTGDLMAGARWIDVLSTSHNLEGVGSNEKVIRTFHVLKE